MRIIESKIYEIPILRNRKTAADNEFFRLDKRFASLEERGKIPRMANHGVFTAANHLRYLNPFFVRLVPVHLPEPIPPLFRGDIEFYFSVGFTNNGVSWHILYPQFQMLFGHSRGVNPGCGTPGECA